jgi:hypothetical protein
MSTRVSYGLSVTSIRFRHKFGYLSTKTTMKQGWTYPVGCRLGWGGRHSYRLVNLSMNPSFSSQSPWLSLVRARHLGNNWQSATASFLGVWVTGEEGIEEVWAGVDRSCHWAIQIVLDSSPTSQQRRHGKEGGLLQLGRSD